MAPSVGRTGKEALHEADLMWLALLAYSREATSRDPSASTATVLTLNEHIEALGCSFVRDGREEAGELGSIVREAVSGGIPLIVSDDGEALVVVGLTWLRRAVEVLHRPPLMTFGQVVKTLPTRSDKLPLIRLRGWTDRRDDNSNTSL